MVIPSTPAHRAQTLTDFLTEGCEGAHREGWGGWGGVVNGQC